MSVHRALLISTTCQRFSLGFFIFSVIAAQILGTDLPMGTVSVIALVFLVVGGIASAFHLGRPARFFNSFANPSSHLTQEVIIIPFLGASLLLCCLDSLFFHWGMAGMVIQWISVLIAIAFLVSTGLVYQLHARPAWDTPLVLLIFLLTSAEIGTMSTLAVLPADSGSAPVALIVLAALALAGCVAAQCIYLLRLTTLGYGVAIRVTEIPYRLSFVLWLITGILAPILALLGTAMTGQPVYAISGAACCIIGIMVWTTLFYKCALKVKMFPMYKVDLNVYM